MKRCTRCGETKPFSAFPLSSSTADGYYSWCKPCKSQYMRDRHQAMKKDGRQAQENLVRSLRRYGVDLDWHAEQLVLQDGVCAICGGEPTDDVGRLSIDHDHAIGKARGLLCGPCNLGLGQFQDDPALLLAAVAYLERTKEQS